MIGSDEKIISGPAGDYIGPEGKSLVVAGCVRISESPLRQIDSRYSGAIRYLMADSARYAMGAGSEASHMPGIHVIDTLVCAAPDLFFQDVFTMGYGRYSEIILTSCPR